MKINVNEIPKDGLVLEETKTGEDLDIEDDYTKFSEPVHITASVKRENNNIQLHIKITSRLQFRCGWCLDPYFQNVNKEIDIIESVKKQTVIDLIQIVREEIILDFPVKLLCSEHCRGLCIICGQNLNKKKCGCRMENNKPISGNSINI